MSDLLFSDRDRSNILTDIARTQQTAQPPAMDWTSPETIGRGVNDLVYELPKIGAKVAGFIGGAAVDLAADAVYTPAEIAARTVGATDFADYLAARNRERDDFRRSMMFTPETDGAAAQVIGPLAQYVGAAVLGSRLGVSAGPLGAELTGAGTFGVVSGRDRELNYRDQGVDPQTARELAVSGGLTDFASALLPAGVGKTLAQRVAFGLGSNVGLGMADRFASNAYLRSAGYEDAASLYQWSDPVSITLDALLGSAFGGLSHYEAKQAARATDAAVSGQRDYGAIEWARERSVQAVAEALTPLDQQVAGAVYEGLIDADTAAQRLAQMRRTRTEGDADVNAFLVVMEELGKRDRERGKPQDQSNPDIPPDLLYVVEERAAMYEEGGHSRADAERLAREDVLERWEVLGLPDQPSSDEIAAAFVMADKLRAEIGSAPGVPRNITAAQLQAAALERAAQQMAEDQAVAVDDLFAQAVAVRALEGKFKSLTQWLIERGGLRDEGGEVSTAIGGRSGRDTRIVGLLNDKGGLSLDDATLFAWENGYLRGAERPTTDALIMALRDEAAGQKVYREADERDLADVRDGRRIAEAFAREGIDINADDAALRAAIERYVREQFAPHKPSPDAPLVMDAVDSALREAGADDPEIAELRAAAAEVDAAIAEGEARLRGMGVDPDLLASRGDGPQPDELGIASQAEAALAKTERKRGNGKAWLNDLTKGGVTKEMLHYVFGPDFAKRTDQIERAEIENTIARNKLALTRTDYKPDASMPFKRAYANAVNVVAQIFFGQYGYGQGRIREWLEDYASNIVNDLEMGTSEGKAGFKAYALEGGSDYRETTYRLPDGRPGGRFVDSHFPNERGLLMHSRSQRWGIGRVVEELQSFAHQKGRDEGYSGKVDLAPLREEVARTQGELRVVAEKIQAFLAERGIKVNVAEAARRMDAERARERYGLGEPGKQVWDADLLREYEIAKSAEWRASYDLNMADPAKMRALPEAGTPLSENWLPSLVALEVYRAAKEGEKGIWFTPPEIQNGELLTNPPQGQINAYGIRVPATLKALADRMGLRLEERELRVKAVPGGERVFEGSAWVKIKVVGFALDGAARRRVLEGPALMASRSLDPMGFYSPAYEAASAVPDNIWQMGYQAARNHMTKGKALAGEGARVGDEIKFLGLDDAFAGTKERGPALRDAVMQAIELQRLVLEERYNRFDPANPPDAVTRLQGRITQDNRTGKWVWRYPLGSRYFDTREEAEATQRQFGDARTRPGGPEAAGIRRGPGDIRLPGDDPVFELRLKLQPGTPGSDFQSHWSRAPSNDDGVVVSVRGEERIDDAGKRTLFGGEVQSDMAQSGRAKKTELEAAASRSLEESIALIRRANPAISDADAQRLGAEMHARNQEALKRYKPEPLTAKTSQWTNAAVRAMVYRAARDGFDSVSFPTGETSKTIQGNSQAAAHYDTNVKGALEKVAAAFGGRVRDGGVEFVKRSEVGADTWVVRAADGTVVADGATREAAERMAKFYGPDSGVRVERLQSVATAYVLDITPAMRAQILERGMPMFARAAPGTQPRSQAATLRARLAPALLRLGKLLPADYITVVQSIADLPPDVQRRLGDADVSGLKGLADRKNGRVYFIADNIRPAELKGLLLHEVGVHLGLRKMIGDKRFAELQAQMQAMRETGQPDVVAAFKRAEEFALLEQHVPEEAMAYLVETAPELPLVRRILAMLAEWSNRFLGTRFATPEDVALGKLERGELLTIDDMRELAAASLRKFRADAEPVRAVGEVEGLAAAKRGADIPQGEPIPREIEQVAGLRSVFAMASALKFGTNRDLKLAMQNRVRTLAEGAGVDLSQRTAEADAFLTRMAVSDALVALETNPGAVGWYDTTVTKALNIVSLIHPEIATDPQAKFAFVWALAVTSNGAKVDANFELAEKAYRHFRKTKKMPTNIGVGTAKKAMNEGLKLYNTLVKKHGVERVMEFMTTKTTVKEVKAFAGKNISGENLTTEVFGAAALGPKIGNGFFMNLYGEFGQLTMDRWFMRTWGRWLGTLIEENPKQVEASRKKIEGLIDIMSPDEREAFGAIIDMPVTKDNIDALALAIRKNTADEETRDRMSEVGLVGHNSLAMLDDVLGETTGDRARLSVGDELRKAANNLVKYLDGQKEQPSGPPERGRIRAIMAAALEELRKTHPTLTMADLQALLWYPEKRLYDSAKADETKTGYEDDEAPDYANAAAGLARKKGVKEQRIVEALGGERVSPDVGAGGARSGERGGGQADPAPGSPSESPEDLIRGQGPLPAPIGFNLKTGRQDGGLMASRGPDRSPYDPLDATLAENPGLTLPNGHDAAEAVRVARLNKTKAEAMGEAFQTAAACALKAGMSPRAQMSLSEMIAGLTAGAAGGAVFANAAIPLMRQAAAEEAGPSRMEEMNRELEGMLDGILYNPERPLTEDEKRVASYYDMLKEAPGVRSNDYPEGVAPGDRFFVGDVSARMGGVEPAGAEQ